MSSLRAVNQTCMFGGRCGEVVFGEERRGGGVHVGDGIFVFQVEGAAVVVFPGGGDGFDAGLVEAMDEEDGAVGLDFFDIVDGCGVGVDKPAFLGGFAGEVLHVFAGRDADACEEGIGEEGLADAFSEVVDGDRIFLVVGDSVLAFGTPGEDVPCVQVDSDAAVVGVLHHVLPEFHFFFDGHFFEGFEMFELCGADHVVTRESVGGVEGKRGAHDVGKGDVGILGDFNHGGEWVKVPKGEGIEALSGHFIEEFVPEIEAPHFGDVLLCGIAGVGVAGGAGVERDVEFDSALGDVGGVIGILEGGKGVEADGFGKIEGAVHGAGGIRARMR